MVLAGVGVRFVWDDYFNVADNALGSLTVCPFRRMTPHNNGTSVSFQQRLSAQVPGQLLEWLNRADPAPPLPNLLLDAKFVGAELGR